MITMTYAQIKEYFNENYPHVDINQIDKQLVMEFMGRSYIKNVNFLVQMDYLYDYILSGDLADVTP